MIAIVVLAHPAKFRRLPSNSGSQKRRCEQSNAPTPASTSSWGLRATCASNCDNFHCNMRMQIGSTLNY